ncbi:hypothetical protein [Agromyces sp. PvR057]|uniref:hypothetical protein n=1 Tax=Agromyces sp. PvR057 TaxID=3156403 RepID=UPI00339A6061
MERDEMGGQVHQDFGQMPGMNDAPLNPSFRDGPASAPRRIRWWEPVLVVAGVATAFVALIIFTDM